jgi:hypothetical protein
MAIPRSVQVPSQTYVEVLAEADTPDTIAPAPLDYERPGN